MCTLKTREHVFTYFEVLKIVLHCAQIFKQLIFLHTGVYS